MLRKSLTWMGETIVMGITAIIGFNEKLATMIKIQCIPFKRLQFPLNSHILYIYEIVS